MVDKLIVIIFLTWSLIAPGFCDLCAEANFTIFNRGGALTVGSALAGSTVLQMVSTQGETPVVASTYVPPTLQAQASSIVNADTASSGMHDPDDEGENPNLKKR